MPVKQKPSTQNRTRQRSDYDTAWKEAITHYFPLFILFFFLDIHEQIDWSREVEFMDKELQQARPKSKSRRKIADMLVKVWLKSGQEAWVLIHIEVQNQQQTTFPERMFIYAYRLYDKYGKPVASLAILGDNNPDWRPEGHGYKVFETGMQHQFRIAKLLDYEQRMEELENSSNPFALMVIVHLRTLSTVRKPQTRMEWKLRLVKGLYEKGMAEEDIVAMFRFMDWIMILPPALEQRFEEEIVAFEEEKKMPAISPFERRAIDKGLQRGREEGALENARDSVLTAVETHWSKIPAGVEVAVKRIEDVGRLRSLLREAMTVRTLEEFERKLGE